MDVFVSWHTTYDRSKILAKAGSAKYNPEQRLQVPTRTSAGQAGDNAVVLVSVVLATRTAYHRQFWPRNRLHLHADS